MSYVPKKIMGIYEPFVVPYVWFKGKMIKPWHIYSQIGFRVAFE